MLPFLGRVLFPASAMAVPTTLAEVWFPPEERTQATAVSALGNQSGTVLLSIIVPLVCPDDSTTTRPDAVQQQWRSARRS